MILAIVIAIASIAAGTLLGLGGRQGALAPLASFAVVAALAVVFVQLLPDAIAGLGPTALLVFIGGLLLPRFLETVVARVAARARATVGLELGYGALLLHQAGDGIGLGTFGGGAHAHHDHFDILLAIAAHTVPMVALLTIAYYRRSGMRAALLRGAGLMIAELAGVLLATLAPETTFAALEPWITAAIAGLLVHVVMHDWTNDRARRSSGTRALELMAIAAGVMLVLLGGHEDVGSAEVRASLLDSLRDLTMRTAPAMLAGIVPAALLSAANGRIGARWLEGGSVAQAIRGALAGAPHPVCACGVLPLAGSLRHRGARAAWIVAFVIAAPGLGLATLTVTAHLLGWPFALVRLLATVTIASASGLAAQRFATTSRAEHAHDTPASTESYWQRALASGDELLLSLTPWMVLGLAAGALAQVVLPSGALAFGGAEVIVVAILALPSYVCATSATPLAAVLIGKGLSPAAAFTGLILGSAINVSTIRFLRDAWGSAATTATVATLLIGTAIMAALSQLVMPVIPQASPTGTIDLVLSGVLGVLVLASLWRHGVRGFLGSLAEGLGHVEPDRDTCMPGHHVHLHADHQHVVVTPDG